MLNGPRRAQAGKPLASSIGPIPEAVVRKSYKQAHAVTSRVTSWAFWFLQWHGFSTRVFVFFNRKTRVANPCHKCAMLLVVPVSGMSGGARRTTLGGASALQSS
jgi:hypothetical protein